MKAMREWVEGPQIVGEFSISPAHVVREAAAFYGLDAVQVRQAVQGRELDALEGLEVILEITIERGFSRTMFKKRLGQQAPFVRYFLLNFARMGISWGEMAIDSLFWKEICATYPVLLHIDFQPEHLPEIVEKVGPAGISLSGGEEERVGVKSFDAIDAIFEKIEDSSDEI